MSGDAADLIWRRFVERVVAALALAARHLASDEMRATLEGSPGWFGRQRGDGRFRGRRIPQENAVTQAIQHTLEHWSKSMSARRGVPVVGLPDISRMHFAVEQPPDQSHLAPQYRRLGRHAPRTDLRIEIRSDEADLDLRLEAKVVLNPDDITASYLGPSGVERFEDAGSPYTLSPWGGMLAYVVDHTDVAWCNRISEAVSERFPGRCEQLNLDGRSYSVSKHDLLAMNEAVRVVRVVHLAIEVESSPSFRR